MQSYRRVPRKDAEEGGAQHELDLVPEFMGLSDGTLVTRMGGDTARRVLS